MNITELEKKMAIRSRRLQNLAVGALCLAGLSMCGTGIVWYRFQPKFAYVKTGELLEKYEGMIDAKKAFQLKAGQYKANVDTLSNEFQQLLHRYERERSRMSTSERKSMVNLLNTKQQQLAQYRQSVQERVRAEDQKMTEEVVTKVNNYLNRFGKNSTYMIVFGANGSGNVLYGHETSDITEEVLAGLNAEYRNKQQ